MSFGPPEPGLNAHSTGWVNVLDGAVVATGQCGYDELALQYLPAGQSRLQITVEEHLALRAGLRDWCVVAGALAPRTASAISLSATTLDADGEDEVVMTGIPTGARLRAWGAVTLAWTLVTGGSVTLTSTAAGRIHLEVQCPAPYLDWHGGVDAV
jgi:hypothetical protein